MEDKTKFWIYVGAAVVTLLILAGIKMCGGEKKKEDGDLVTGICSHCDGVGMTSYGKECAWCNGTGYWAYYE